MADRPAEGDGVEITPEMIEAGGRVLRDFFEVGRSTGDSIAGEVYSTMISLLPLDSVGEEKAG